MDRHYLDHASTSPARPEAIAAVTSWLARPRGDTGRIHAEGLAARVAVEEARERVAALFGARPRSVVLTSGATEAIAAACWGAAERGRHQVLAAVEQLIGDDGYCFGAVPGLADVYLIPQLYAAERFNVSLQNFPRIRRVAALATVHPAFQKAHPANQPDTP